MQEIITATNNDVVTLEPITYKGEVVITTNQLAESYETDVKNISNNFNRNKTKFEEKVHYYLLQGEELKKFKAIHLLDESLKFVSQLYLWTHRGASRHCKILDTDKAWEQFDVLEENYFEGNKNKPTCIEDVLITSLQEMKMIKQQLNQVNNNALRANKIATEAQEEVKSIKEVVSLDTTSWRSETSKLLAKIASNQGGFEHLNMLRTESYDLMDKRLGIDLKRRLTNRRRVMAEEGISKSKREKMNYLDVISEDKKLIEGYVAIVKDMAIKYGISNK